MSYLIGKQWSYNCPQSSGANEIPMLSTKSSYVEITLHWWSHLCLSAFFSPSKTKQSHLLSFLETKCYGWNFSLQIRGWDNGLSSFESENVFADASLLHCKEGFVPSAHHIWVKGSMSEDDCLISLKTKQKKVYWFPILKPYGAKLDLRTLVCKYQQYLPLIYSPSRIRIVLLQA